MSSRGHTYEQDAKGLWSCECSNPPHETREEAEAACRRRAEEDEQRAAEEWAADVEAERRSWGLP